MQIAPPRLYPSKRPNWPVIAWGLGIFALGLWLRIGWINHESVGHDEAFSILLSRRPLAEMWQPLIRDFVHPPLHYLLLHGWFDLTGWGVFQARILSAMFSSLSVPMLYFVARLFFDRQAALIASFLLAISQLTIMLADEPRPYAQVLLLSLVATYLFVRALRERTLGIWSCFAACCIAMLYTHYFSVFTIAALGLFALIFRSRYPLSVPRVLTVIVAVAAYAPWLTSGIVSAAAHTRRTLSGQSPWWAVHWYTFFTALNTFNNGKFHGLLNSSPAWSYVAGGVIFCGPVLLAIRETWNGRRSETSQTRVEREGIVLALALWILPVFLAIAAGFLHVQYNVRYIAFAAAPYYLLVARGLSGIRPTILRWAMLALVGIYSAYSLRANFVMRWKEDFRGAYEYISEGQAEGDCEVFLPDFVFPGQWQVVQASRPGLRVISREDFDSGASDCRRIWAISFAPGGDARWQARARTRARSLTGSRELHSTRSFYDGEVDLYVWKSAPHD